MFNERTHIAVNKCAAKIRIWLAKFSGETESSGFSRGDCFNKTHLWLWKIF